MIKQALLDNLKNLRGWRAPRKFVAFAVDDYCSVRVASAKALGNLQRAGLDISGRFDRLDAVETRQDLEALFTVLDSVRGGDGRPAIFTAYALSANPDFARIREGGKNYEYESVPQTFARLSYEQRPAYEGAWALWQEGIRKGLIQPQFHGREHFNVDLFEHKLRSGSTELRVNLENNSVAALSGEPSMPGVGFTHAFGLHARSELARHEEILRNGLDLFQKVWGLRSVTFTPPALQLHPSLYRVVEEGGVRSIDKPLRCVRAMGNGEQRREMNHSGRQRGQVHMTVVRNVVFEPCTDMGVEPVEHATAQVAAAFRWGRPAIISSHRVNYGGHLDEANRTYGLDALRRLLRRIVERWPEVEFVSVDQLIDRMEAVE
ncbi:MAG: hypothetical protein ABS41_07385 [Arenimonas sp. SCN 70-307]|uniref:hypothetical protein n=1 Tax=Arenimonas sp. SCN 70-307 TaxID=1660089 RepID=UPI00086D2D81|nr:hypothetical protein [Arenimonas sp. SCN 70-307]ODS62987.1 MAG: hypothetical protein ABS41_07385 [Arenimonas sp. SCN 70-307]